MLLKFLLIIIPIFLYKVFKKKIKINQKINELDWVDEVYVYPPMTDCGLNLGASIHKAVELGDMKTSKKFKNVFWRPN